VAIHPDRPRFTTRLCGQVTAGTPIYRVLRRAPLQHHQTEIRYDSEY
jgi:hypothetical protein